MKTVAIFFAAVWAAISFYELLVNKDMLRSALFVSLASANYSAYVSFRVKELEEMLKK